MITAYIFFGVAFLCFAFYLVTLFMQPSANDVKNTINPNLDEVEDYVEEYANDYKDEAVDYIEKGLEALN